MCSFIQCAFLLCLFYFSVLFYFITFTPKWFALAMAMAAVSAELRATLPYKICKILQFLCRFVNSVHDSLFHARWPILRKILHVQKLRILTSLISSFTNI